MNEPDEPSFLDRIVERLCALLESLGLPGARLRWRWARWRREAGEQAMRGRMWARSTAGRYKACPQCRALAPRRSSRCPECGASLASVRGPGLVRALENLLPGSTAVTTLLLLVNGAFFLFTVLAAARWSEADAPSLAHVMRIPLGVLDRFGAGIPLLVFQEGYWWRTVTSLFLHGGLIHFGFNMFILVQLGPLAESEYGPERFWLAFLGSGLGGSLLTLALNYYLPVGLGVAGPFHPAMRVVGASGAIMGLVGMLLVHGWRRGGSAGAALKGAMARYAVYVLILSLLPGVSLLSHLGGLLAGAGIGLVMPWGPPRSAAAARLWGLAAAAAAAVVVLSFYLVSRETLWDTLR